MMTRSRPPLVMLLVLGLALIITLCIAPIITPSIAHASGLSTPSVGRASSNPVSDDLAAVYWNPAGLTRVKRLTLLGNLSLAIGDVRVRRTRRATYQREDSFDFAQPIDPESIDPMKTGDAPESRANPVVPAPGIFGALPLGDRLVAGFGIYAPYGAILSMDEGGAQRWQLQSATLLAVAITPALAWRVTERVSVGAGVSYMIGYAELKKVQDFAALADVGEAIGRPPINQPNDFGASAPPAVRELEVMARPISLYDMWAHSLTFHASIDAQLTDALRVALTYQHKAPMTYRGKFALDMSDDFFTQDLASQGLQYKPLVLGDATLSLTLPNHLFGGLAWTPAARWRLELWGGWSRWSTVEAFDVRVRSADLAQPDVGLPDTAAIALPRRWQDTATVEVVARHTLTDRWHLSGGLGYQSSASPDSTIDAASPDGDRLVAHAGATFQLTADTALLGDLKLHHVLPREVVGSDYDLANGRYRLTLYTIGGHLRMAF